MPGFPKPDWRAWRRPRQRASRVSDGPVAVMRQSVQEQWPDSPERLRKLLRTRWELVLLPLVTLTLLVLGAALNTTLYGMNVIIGLTLAVAHAGSILLTYSRPLDGLLLSIACVTVIAWVISPESTLPRPFTVVALITQLVITVISGFRAPWYLAAAGWLASIVLVSLGASHLGTQDVPQAEIINMVVFASISFGLLLGSVITRQRQLIREQLSVERNLSAAEVARRELIEERAAIARELHDVVAHGMSLVTVQATTARYRYPGMDEQVVAEFDEIAGHSRRAMSEMRQLLGVLRSEYESREILPQPGLEDLDALLGSIRRAGIEVDLEMPKDLNPGPVLGLTIYRIIQEALSNVVRHAPESQASVDLELHGEVLTVVVENGAAKGIAAVGSGGHGLVGMQERAQAVGGRLDYGPLPGGGFRVVATLPSDGEVVAAGLPKTRKSK